MSKIEEAIRKAQANRLKGGLPAINNNRVMVSKDLIIPSKKSILAKRASGNSLISDMDDSKCLSLDELIEKQIIFPEMNSGSVANSFRNLRTKLLQKSNGENFIVLVTSCVDSMDSSFVSLNLSAAFSLDRSKTSLIIDCNLNNPKIDRLLGMETELGLTDYLDNDDLPLDKVIYSGGIKRLRIIPAGNSSESSSEYFVSEKMKILMDSLVERYADRYIFVDAPSLTDSADSEILMSLCDFVVLVVPYGKVTTAVLQKTVRTLDSEKFVGIIMNEIPVFVG